MAVSGWKEAWDEASSHIYYYNEQTGETSWKMPPQHLIMNNNTSKGAAVVSTSSLKPAAAAAYLGTPLPSPNADPSSSGSGYDNDGYAAEAETSPAGPNSATASFWSASDAATPTPRHHSAVFTYDRPQMSSPASRGTASSYHESMYSSDRMALYRSDATAANEERYHDTASSFFEPSHSRAASTHSFHTGPRPQQPQNNTWAAQSLHSASSSEAGSRDNSYIEPPSEKKATKTKAAPTLSISQRLLSSFGSKTSSKQQDDPVNNKERPPHDFRSNSFMFSVENTGPTTGYRHSYQASYSPVMDNAWAKPAPVEPRSESEPAVRPWHQRRTKSAAFDGAVQSWSNEAYQDLSPKPRSPPQQPLNADQPPQLLQKTSGGSSSGPTHAYTLSSPAMIKSVRNMFSGPRTLASYDTTADASNESQTLTSLAAAAAAAAATADSAVAYPAANLSAKLSARHRSVDATATAAGSRLGSGNFAQLASIAKAKAKARAEAMTKTAPRRLRIIREIVESERSYLSSLHTLLEMFIEPLSTAACTAPLMADARVAVFFSNVEQVVALNERMLTDFEARLEVWDNAWANSAPDANEDTALAQVCFGDVFVEYAPLLRIYSQYAKNYGMAVSVLTPYLDRHEDANDIVRVAEARGHTLFSFLIMPIQRVPRYELLLKELLKHTNEAHRDTKLLKQALNDVTKAAEYIDEAIRERESHEEMLKVVTKFSRRGDPMLARTHKLLKTGTLFKLNRKGRRIPHTFMLFADQLCYGERASTFGGKGRGRPGRPRINRTIELETCTVKEETFELQKLGMHGFLVQSPVKTFLACAESKHGSKEWFAAIQKAISDRKTVLLESSSRALPSLGTLEQTSTTMYNGATDAAAHAAPLLAKSLYCAVCGSKFGLILRCHHCKACGRSVCSKCSSGRSFLAHSGSKKAVRVCDFCKDDAIEAAAATKPTDAVARGSYSSRALSSRGSSHHFLPAPAEVLPQNSLRDLTNELAARVRKHKSAVAAAEYDDLAAANDEMQAAVITASSELSEVDSSGERRGQHEDDDGDDITDSLRVRQHSEDAVLSSPETSTKHRQKNSSSGASSMSFQAPSTTTKGHFAAAMAELLVVSERVKSVNCSRKPSAGSPELLSVHRAGLTSSSKPLNSSSPNLMLSMGGDKAVDIDEEPSARIRRARSQSEFTRDLNVFDAAISARPKLLVDPNELNAAMAKLARVGGGGPAEAANKPSEPITPKTVAEKLISLENEYINQLDDLLNTFVRPLMRSVVSTGVSALSSSVAIVFDSVENIYTIHCQLRDRLVLEIMETTAAASDDTDTITLSLAAMLGKFAELARKFYVVYAKHHGEAGLCFEKVDVLALIEDCVKQAGRPDNGAMLLTKELLIPLQRLTVYIQQLEQLRLLLVDKGREDLLGEVSKARSAVQYVWRRVNEILEKRANFETLAHLESLFLGNVHLTVPNRVFVRWGMLSKFDRHGKVEQLAFHLFSDALIYSECASSGFKLRRQIPLDSCELVQEGRNAKDKYKNAFQLKTNSKGLVIGASSAAEKADWVTSINECVGQLKLSLSQRVYKIGGGNKRLAERTSASVSSMNIAQENTTETWDGDTWMNDESASTVWVDESASYGTAALLPASAQAQPPPPPVGSAPLESMWTRYLTATGDEYFYDSVTGRSTWTKPAKFRGN